MAPKKATEVEAPRGIVVPTPPRPTWHARAKQAKKKIEIKRRGNS